LLELLPCDVKQDSVPDERLTVAFATGGTGAAHGHVRHEKASGDTRLELVPDRARAHGQDSLVKLTRGGRLRGAPV
jgi:hypothetical protein